MQYKVPKNFFNPGVDKVHLKTGVIIYFALFFEKSDHFDKKMMRLLRIGRSVLNQRPHSRFSSASEAHAAQSASTQPNPQETSQNNPWGPLIQKSEFKDRRKNVMLDIFMSDQDLDNVNENVNKALKAYQINPELPTKYVSIVVGNEVSYLFWGGVECG